MILFDSGVPLANVALTDTFSTQRTRVNQVMNLTSGHAANNVFTGSLNTFNNNVNFKAPVTAPLITANSASFKVLQADFFDLDGDVTVDTVTANSFVGTITTASQTNITGVGALAAGSISSGFGNIDVGSSNIDGGTITAATSLVGTLGTAAQPNITSVGTLAGLTVTGMLNAAGLELSANTVVTANVNFGDNDYANFGHGKDLQIYHDGTHSYIDDAVTGNLRLRGDSLVQIMSHSDNETMAYFMKNGAVGLYHDNSEKLATTATGISVTGDVVSSSDERLKENVRSISNALDIVKQLNGVRFKWKEDGRESIGFTAQQIEPILPEVINTDENGSKSVNYSVIVSVLVEAIKELSDKIENQG